MRKNSPAAKARTLTMRAARARKGALLLSVLLDDRQPLKGF
jgi:hypothetical protein